MSTIAPELLVCAEDTSKQRIEDLLSLHNTCSSDNPKKNNTNNPLAAKKTDRQLRDEIESQLPQTLSIGGVKPDSFASSNINNIPEGRNFWNIAPCRVACWNCHEPFSTRPLGMPISWNAVTKIFQVRGCFCHPGCMKRYVTDRDNLGAPKQKILQMMKLMFVLVYKIMGPITAAPPPEIMSKYTMDGSGPDIVEYRTICSKMVSSIEIVPDCFTFAPVSIARQNILSFEEMKKRIEMVDVLERLRMKTIARKSQKKVSNNIKNNNTDNNSSSTHHYSLFDFDQSRVKIEGKDSKVKATAATTMADAGLGSTNINDRKGETIATGPEEEDDDIDNYNQLEDNEDDDDLDDDDDDDGYEIDQDERGGDKE